MSIVAEEVVNPLTVSGSDVAGEGRAGHPHTSPNEARCDDEQFARALHARYYRPLVSIVVRLTGGDRYWAEDVAQETVVRAWRHADHLLGGAPKSLLPWLTTVARRIVINDRRSRRSRPQEVYDTSLAALAVEDDTERALQRMTIDAALSHLSPAHRVVIVETYLRGHTAEEVGRKLGIPAGTVKSRAFYAMRSLRATLAHAE